MINPKYNRFKDINLKTTFISNCSYNMENIAIGFTNIRGKFLLPVCFKIEISETPYNLSIINLEAKLDFLWRIWFSLYTI